MSYPALATVSATAPPGAPRSALAPPQWEAIRKFMERACGVVLRADQAYLADSRLGGVAKAHAFPTIDAYVRAATAPQAPTALTASLVDAMTTHETLFFRDLGFWKCATEKLVPRLAAKLRAGGTARVWSAACSTGQEPYSLAILLEELVPDVASRVEIVATDVSEAAIGQARAGVFTTLEVNRGLSGARLVRHFEQQPGGFRVREHLRSRVAFSTHNLLGARPDPRDCDLVMCRNVLIYFGETDRAAVVTRLNQAATADGVIVVGATESLKDAIPLAPGVYPRGR